MLPDEKLTTQLHIRISPQLKDELDKAAGKHQTTVSSLFRAAIELIVIGELNRGAEHGPGQGNRSG